MPSLGPAFSDYNIACRTVRFQNFSCELYDNISCMLTVDYKILLKIMSTIKGRNCKARIGILTISGLGGYKTDNWLSALVAVRD